MPQHIGRDTINYQRLRAQHKRESRRLHRPCWLCGQPIRYEAEPGADDGYSTDHIRPVSTHPDLAEDYRNFAAAHLICNKQRGSKAPRFRLGTPSRHW